ncbi:MAG: hypothetical protein JW712_06775 [Dehalococcoidales bacterium]|nr:hypothetical protein [Dehalococcoidales bacterium]
MKLQKLLILFTALIITAYPFVTGSCEGENAVPPSPLNDIKLDSIMVPDADIDICAFFLQKQVEVPGHLFNWTENAVAQQVVLWGMPGNKQLVIGGSLLFAEKSTATQLYRLLSEQSEAWVHQSDRTMYFVHGTGNEATVLQNTIHENRFIPYNGGQAAIEVTLLPDSGRTKLLAAGVINPSDALIKLITDSLDPAYVDTVDSIVTQGRIEALAVGFYGPGDVDVPKIVEGFESGSIWDTEFGITVILKSDYSGILFAPIARGILENGGYTKTTAGELTLYKNTLIVNDDISIPIYIRIDGNRVYATVSGVDSYAQLLAEKSAEKPEVPADSTGKGVAE